tara:strand:+ start:909 stop:1121 length:213 start_codon:yes stop_codon:yes gene_type:complete
MGTKTYLALAFLTAANCALAVMNDEKDSDLAAYLWGGASVLYFASAGTSAKDKRSKQKLESDKVDRYDVM